MAIKSGIRIIVNHREEDKYTEYEGIDIDSGKRLFYNTMPCGTPLIGHFVGAVHALMYCKKKMDLCTIYTEYQQIIDWIEHNGKKGVSIPTISRKESAKAKELLNRSLRWLIEQKYKNKVELVQDD